MTSLGTQRFHKLAGSIAEIKVQVRAALATELAGAVGTTVRDLLVVALIDRIIATPARSPMPRRGERRDEQDDRDRWGASKDPWGDPNDVEDERLPVSTSRYEDDDREEETPAHAVPTVSALAVGVNVGRLWLARHGTLAAAIGFGVLTTVLGLAGGPLARATLAVLAAASDVLTAESALSRLAPS